MDVLSASPESIARRRRQALQDAEQRFKMNRLTGDFYAARLNLEALARSRSAQQMLPSIESRLPPERYSGR